MNNFTITHHKEWAVCFVCEKESMVVVLLVSMTSNVDARMVVNHTVEPPERMESKRYGCNLPDVPVAEIDT